MFMLNKLFESESESNTYLMSNIHRSSIDYKYDTYTCI